MIACKRGLLIFFKREKVKGDKFAEVYMKKGYL